MRPGTAAVILAGGRGERLGGVIKANLTIGGIRLIDRVRAALGGAAPVLVARGGFGTESLSLPQGAIAVDDTGGGGPLAGVAGALGWLAQQDEVPEFLLSVAVDTPFFPPDFVAAALPRMASADAAVAAFEGQLYPTNALWRVAAIAPLVGEARSLKGLIELIPHVAVDWPEVAGGNPFANANTPSELAELEARARTHFGVGKPDQTG